MAPSPVFEVTSMLALLAIVLLPAASAQDDPRPTPVTLGIGAGVTVPSSPLGVNTASARLRLSNDVTLEPVVGFQTSRTRSTLDTTTGDDETVTTASLLTVDPTVRYRANGFGPVDALLLAGVGGNMGWSTVDPEGTDNDIRSRTLAFDVSWGLGIDWFANEHWSVSADATNPLFVYSRTVTEDEAAETDQTDVSTTLGLTWAPTIRLMAHLWF